MSGYSVPLNIKKFIKLPTTKVQGEMTGDFSAIISAKLRNNGTLWCENVCRGK
jgi:hypothetical protein